MTKRRLRKALNKFDDIKKKKDVEVPGILGFTIGGKHITEVANRRGFVYVRLRNNANEVIQAYNDQVSPVYGLPVILIRDETDRTRYKVKGKDLGVYQDWNNTPYLPRHGNQHSFNPAGGGGGDVTFIYNRQFVPLSVQPSGSSGAADVIVQPYAYYQGAQWKYAGGTGTASLLPFRPTGTSARMVLVYLNSDGNPSLLGGSSYFAESITGSAAILPYVPALANSSDIPLAGIRLVSGTSVIAWDNIYDLRPFLVGDGFIPTGTSGHIIQDDGTPLAQQPSLNFIGSNFSIYNSGGATNISGSFVGGVSGGITERAIPVYEDEVFRVTGTVLNFTTNMNVAVTGSVAFISSVGGSGTDIGARVYRNSDFIFTGTSADTGIAIPFTQEEYDTDGIHSGTSTKLNCNTAGYYLIIGNATFVSTTGVRLLGIKYNGTTVIARQKVAALTAINISTTYYLNVGDYVELIVDRGTVVDDTISYLVQHSPEFMMHKL